MKHLKNKELTMNNCVPFNLFAKCLDVNMYS